MKIKNRYLFCVLVVFLLIAGTLTGCGSPTPAGGPSSTQINDRSGASLLPVELKENEKLKVVVTTNILGDVVRQVAGDYADLTILMKIGTEPHTYMPSPADSAAIYDAHLVILNGAGLEASLEKLIESTGAGGKTIEASFGLSLRKLDVLEGAPTPAGNTQADLDPHVWFDVQNAIHWVDTISSAISKLDPKNADHFAVNATNYKGQLEALDQWIIKTVADVPQKNRRLVTSHPVFGYFADRYGFEQVGAIYPINPSAEPSAKELAALEDVIRQFGVPAVFTESTINTRLAKQVAADTGVKLITLYTESLGVSGSGAGNYIAMMQFDIQAIVNALR